MKRVFQIAICAGVSAVGIAGVIIGLLKPTRKSSAKGENK